MSVLKNRSTLRWLVPLAAAVTVVGGGAAIGTFAANAEPALPPRSAAQLLVDLQTARLDGLSGTVVQRADLGLPKLVGLAGGDAALLSGTHTLRVWYSGPDRQRVALLDTLGERDVIRSGRDVWTWDSKANTATHRTLPESTGRAAEGALPVTPQEAAERALAAVDPSTLVTTGRSATVAGRDAYELVLTPRDEASLVHQVRIAIDATEHVPLRFEVLADGADQPAFEMAFTQVDYRRPDADQFTFNPPPGVKVTEATGDLPGAKAGAGSKVGAHPEARAGSKPGAGDDAGLRTVGTGWATVLVVRTDEADEAGKPAGGAAKPGPADGPGAAQALDLLNGLPKVSGDWGSGRLFAGKLFSVLLTDDGRVLAGAVTPERLYQAARG
ncbi:Outer membrane lipoprotein-sorting protein [Micromonospora matsumotoense]|uniref:Outer membrane lipoprotein-sorting protein n=1 Tax=Micromonospora matsumotoense TaxID=121616 RepID=A0A1C5AK20_9ACTN|nr:sigma-E factor regulatory protein RseB domain-containing protein [Micromonospora matsumotoense]SCF45539.1 Outer membrane lipoprotein-sorting protein [Micromonospora matsumotoense]